MVLLICLIVNMEMLARLVALESMQFGSVLQGSLIFGVGVFDFTPCPSTVLGFVL